MRGAAGVVTGAGRQATGALINFCTYWGVGLSLAATLAFYAGLGVRGLWYGVMAGSGTQARRSLIVPACLQRCRCVHCCGLCSMGPTAWDIMLRSLLDPATRSAGW